MGESRFEGLVEITARSLDNPPDHFPWIDSWLEFNADDGSLSGSVPGFVFKGGTTKRVMSGKWQHWPGVAANTAFASSVLLLNYHPRPTSVRLDLFAQVAHHDAQVVRVVEMRGAPDLPNDLLTRHDLAGVLRQNLQYQIFLRTKDNPFAVDRP